jgi:hypothetical protein
VGKEEDAEREIDNNAIQLHSEQHEVIRILQDLSSGFAVRCAEVAPPFR